MTDDPDDAAENRGVVVLGREVIGDEEIEVDRSIEPGSPTTEHMLFVVLGALVTVLVFLDGIGLL